MVRSSRDSRILFFVAIALFLGMGSSARAGVATEGPTAEPTSTPRPPVSCNLGEPCGAASGSTCSHTEDWTYLSTCQGTNCSGPVSLPMNAGHVNVYTYQCSNGKWETKCVDATEATDKCGSSSAVTCTKPSKCGAPVKYTVYPPKVETPGWKHESNCPPSKETSKVVAQVQQKLANDKLAFMEGVKKGYDGALYVKLKNDRTLSQTTKTQVLNSVGRLPPARAADPQVCPSPSPTQTPE